MTISFPSEDKHRTNLSPCLLNIPGQLYRNVVLPEYQLDCVLTLNAKILTCIFCSASVALECFSHNMCRTLIAVAAFNPPLPCKPHHGCQAEEYNVRSCLRFLSGPLSRLPSFLVPRLLLSRFLIIGRFLSHSINKPRVSCRYLERGGL